MDFTTTRRLGAVVERLTRALRGRAEGGGLSSVAASTLYALSVEGPARITALAAAERVTQPAMTQLVDRLERDGLVERRADPADGRARVIHATDAGRALSAARRHARAAALHEFVETLDAHDRDALEAAMPALERIAELVVAPAQQPQHATASH